MWRKHYASLKKKFERLFYVIVTWLSCNKLHKTDRERNSVKDECLKNANVTFPQMSS